MTTTADTGSRPGTLPETIRAAVFVRAGTVELQTRPRPVLADPADVLLRVEACGICGTDLHILEDPPAHPATQGVVLGHEMVGRVVQTGPQALGLAVGDRVVVSPNLSCGSCTQCKRGLFSACENFSTVGIFRDGALADLVAVPARACHVISPDLPRRTAALAEPLSCVLNGVQQAEPRPGQVAVVLGAGAIGLLFLATLRQAGVRCVVVEPSAPRRQAAERMGAWRVLDPGSQDVTAEVLALTRDGVDLAVDAVGSLLPTALDLVRPRGRVLLFGMNSRARGEIAQNLITRKELVVLGTYVGDFTFPDAVRLLESGLLDLDPVISHWVPLDRLHEGLAALADGSAVKVVVDVIGDQA
jgi:threonine dehydrogenase-like Zn-dependent dehydrogenase